MDLLVLQTGAIIGITNVIKKIVPPSWRDWVLPLAALLLGVGAVVGTEGLTVLLAFKGILLGGTATGLYGVAKDIKRS